MEMSFIQYDDGEHFFSNNVILNEGIEDSVYVGSQNEEFNSIRVE